MGAAAGIEYETQEAFSEAEAMLARLGLLPVRYKGVRRIMDPNDLALYEQRQRRQCAEDAVSAQRQTQPASYRAVPVGAPSGAPSPEPPGNGSSGADPSISSRAPSHARRERRELHRGGSAEP